MIEVNTEKESGKSVLAAQHDDDDIYYIYLHVEIKVGGAQQAILALLILNKPLR